MKILILLTFCKKIRVIFKIFSIKLIALKREQHNNNNWLQQIGDLIKLKNSRAIALEFC